MNFSTFSVIGTVNAGICITFPNGRKIWVDLYPDGVTPLFSHMKSDEWEAIKKDPRLSPPDLILFSHTHPDHFSAVRTAEVRRIWPEVPVFLPDGSVWRSTPEEEPFDHMPMRGDEVLFTIDGITVRMIRTVHSGQQFVDVPHYSFLITCNGKNLFIAGDALLTEDRLNAMLECTRTDLAILTFPWASTSAGRERVEYSIQPSHVLLYHIPDVADDNNGFRSAAVSGSELLNTPDIRKIMSHLQEEIFDL